MLVMLHPASIREIVAGVRAVDSIPPTEPDTEVTTPLETDVALSNSILLSTSAAIVSATQWDIYEVTHLEKDYYYKKLFVHFSNINGKDRYQLIKSKDWVRIKDGQTVIFKCERNNYSLRNLYLELHSCGYRCDEWISSRQSLSLDFVKLNTPPDSCR